MKNISTIPQASDMGQAREEKGHLSARGGSDSRVEGSEPSCGLAGWGRGPVCRSWGSRAPPVSHVESLEDQWGLEAWIPALPPHPQI